MNKEDRDFILDNLTMEQIKVLYILLTIGSLANMRDYVKKSFDYEDGTNDNQDALLTLVNDFVKSNWIERIKMNNRQELINAYQEIIKSLTVEELKNFYEENELGDDYERILMSMPKKAEMETFRVSLTTSILNWIEFDALTEEDLQDLIQYLTNKKDK